MIMDKKKIKSLLSTIPLLMEVKWLEKLKDEIMSTNQTGNAWVSIFVNTPQPNSTIIKQMITLRIKLITWLRLKADVTQVIER